MDDLSIIIVNWNTRDFLRDCLRSIYDQRGALSLEVIVSDNDSQDGTQAMVREEFPDVTLIENGRNLGFAAANNVGIRLARGRYILLLNPDTIVLDRAIEKTVHYAEAHPKIGVVGCRVMENEAVVQRTCFSFPTPFSAFCTEFGLRRLFPRSRMFNRAELGWWDRNSEREVDVVSGMYMLVRREALEQVGLLDEAYFVYAEEADLCFRMWKAGWPCVFVPVAQIIHRDGGSKSTRQVSGKMFVQMHKSLLIFHRKNWGYGAYLQLKWVYILSMVVRLPLYALFVVIKRSPLWRSRKSAAWAALQFHMAKNEPSIPTDSTGR